MMIEGISTAFGSAEWIAVLIDYSVKSTVLLVVAWALSAALRGASASARHQVWGAAVCAILALPLLSASLPAWRAPILPDSLALRPAPVTDLRVEATASGDRASGDRATLTSTPTGAVAAGDEVASTRTGNAGPESWSGDRRGSGAASAPSLGSDPRSARWQSLGFIWFLGTLLVLGRLLISAFGAWKVARDAQPVTDADLVAEVDALCRELEIRKIVSVVEHASIKMPMAWGVWRQTILLPVAARSWEPSRRRVVLVHELAHLKRWDCQILLLARVMTALHWFNPLAWVALRRLQSEREHACDDLVLTAGTPGPDYAQHLLDIARTVRSSLTANWATVAMARPSELEGRLLAILDPEVDRASTSRLARAGLLMIALLALPLASVQPTARAQEPAGATASAPAADAVSSSRAHADTPEVVEKRRARRTAAFVSALQDEDPSIRAQAVRSLGMTEAMAAIPALTEILQQDASAEVRSQAAWALGTLGNGQAGPALVQALKDASVRVRQGAAWALGMIENEQASEALGVLLLEESSPETREKAAWALGMIEDGASVTPLVAALEGDSSAAVREKAAWALGMIESPTSLSSLIAALESDSSAVVREKAAWALGMVGDEAALDSLLDAMETDEEPVRARALWAVGQISQ